MEITRCIQAAVARADLWVCGLGPWLAYALVVVGIVWLAIWMGKRL